MGASRLEGALDRAPVPPPPSKKRQILPLYHFYPLEKVVRDF